MSPDQNAATAEHADIVSKLVPQLLCESIDQKQARQMITIWLDRALFASLCVVAAVAPHFAHPARLAFEAALLLWVIRLLVSERHYEPQPLTLPLLVFLTLLGVATALSYVPLLSWLRTGWLVLLMLSVVVAQNVKTLKQIRTLVLLVLLSAMVSALRTGWQYAYGIGTELVAVPPGSPLARYGIESGDLVQLMNGHRTRSPNEWREALNVTRAEPKLRLHMARGTPIVYFDVTVDRKDVAEWLNSPQAAVKRGRPLRAQGHVYHYVPYAGELLELALLAFGLLVVVPGGRRVLRLGLAITFLALTAALVATVTRTCLAALLFGCTVELWLVHKRARTIAVVGLLLCLLASTLWIEKERSMGWLALKDPGTEYRLLMWKDSLRLIPQHPWFGVGPDSAFQYGDQWHIEAYQKFPLRSHFHSSYIQLAVDCGLPCLAAWLWLMAGYLLFLRRSWRRSHSWDWFPRGILLGIFGGGIGFVTAGLVHYNLGDGEVVVLVSLFMGLAMALGRMSPELATEHS